MSELYLGLTIALVGMLGTLLALGFLAIVIYLLHSLLPPTEESNN